MLAKALHMDWRTSNGLQQMNTKDFERRLTLLTGWTSSEVDQRMRPLREAGVLGRGAGRHTPSLTAVEAVVMLLQLGARRASEATDYGKHAWNLKAVTPPDAPEWIRVFLESERLVEVLAVALQSPHSVSVHSLRVASDASAAWVTFRRGSSFCEVWFTGSDEAREWVSAHPETYSNQGATYVGHNLFVGHAAFEEIVLSLDLTKQSGWVNEPEAVPA